jgi:hypothetical protein
MQKMTKRYQVPFAHGRPNSNKKAESLHRPRLGIKSNVTKGTWYLLTLLQVVVQVEFVWGWALLHWDDFAVVLVVDPCVQEILGENIAAF